MEFKVFVLVLCTVTAAFAQLDDEDILERSRRSPGGWSPNGGGSSFPGSRGNVGSSGDRGGWNAGINHDKGRGPQVRVEADRNIYTSPKGNVRVDGHGHYEAGRGRKPDYGVGVKATGRWRREANPGGWSPNGGGSSFPGNTGNNGNQDRGGWNAGINHDKGSGPQVRVEADRNIYTSPNGNVRVDGHGHYEAGRGRKPDYGVGVKATGRWRREANPGGWSPNGGGSSFPGNTGNNGNQDRGGWNAGINHDKGSGPQVRVEADRNIYTSPNGNVRVDGHGHYEAGRGRKPDYGVGVKATGRWRREANPGDGNSRVEMRAEKHGRREPSVRAEVSRTMWASKDGNTRLEARAHREQGGGRRPDNGGSMVLSTRWRRQAKPQQQPRAGGDRGSISITREQTRGQKPIYRADGNVRMWQSNNGRSRLDANGNYQRGGGMRPNYGGGVTFTHRFRRDIEEEAVPVGEAELVEEPAFHEESSLLEEEAQ